MLSSRKARRMVSELKEIAEAQTALMKESQDEVEAREHLNISMRAEYAVFKAPGPKFTEAQKVLLKGAYEQIKAQLDATEEKPYVEKGSVLRAYISEIDGTIQTYSVSIPDNYDAEFKWPLIVSLHAHGWYGRFQGHPAPHYSGAVCLSPGGRGSTDYKEIGEDDVLAAIAEVKRDFNIDEDRVYVTGVSMGGTGAFSLGVHYADQFAAILPICGNADNEAWTYRWGWNRKYEGRNDALRKILQERNSARYYAENLLLLPTYIIAGSADNVVPVDHSRNVVEVLRKYNANVQYREFPNCGHGGYPKESMDDALAWTCSWKRNAEPAAIFWKADRLRHGQAWWTRMEQFARPLAAGYVRANAAPGKITVSTSNLLALSLRKPESICGSKPVALVVDGQTVKLHNQLTANTWTTIRRDPIHGWLDEQDVPRPGLIKKRGLEGPIDDALRAPFAVVVGTSTTMPGMSDAWEREADAFAAEWKRRNGGECRVMLDKDCKLEDMQKYNLVLFGGARDNAVSELIAQYMPLAAITSLLPAYGEDPDNGPHSLESAGLGSFVLYPNKEYAPERMVVMVSANSPEAAYQCWGRFGNWFNWGVHDSSKYFDYAVYDAHSVSPETMLITGWFGTDWTIENGVFYLGNEKLRKQTPPMRFPEKLDLAEYQEKTLPLVKLMPDKIDQMRGAVAFGRGFFGDDLNSDIALGMRAPCDIEYTIEDGAFTEFTSEVGLVPAREMTLRDARRKAEKVAFKVYGDDELLQECTVSWEEPTAQIKASLRNVKVLKLSVVPAGGPSWQHSGAAWLTPTLHK